MICEKIRIAQKLLAILTRAQLLCGGLVLAAAILAAALETLGVSIIIPLVNVLLNPQKVKESELLNDYLTCLGLESDVQLIFAIVSVTIAVYLMKNIYFIWFSWLKYRFSCKVQRECSLYMMKSYLNRGYAFFLNTGYNELTEGVNGDVGRLYTVLIGLIQIISQILIVTFIGIFMLIADWQIALSVLLAAAICLLVIVTVFRRSMSQAGQRIREYSVITGQSFYECVQGIKETMALRKQTFFLKNYEENMIQRQNAEVAYNVGVESPAYVIEGLCVSAIMTVLCVRTLSMDDPTSFVAVLASFAVGAFRILPALGKISSSANSISAVAFCVDRVYDNLVEARGWNKDYYNVEVKDNPIYDDFVFQDALVGNNLSFSYGANLDNVIENLTIQIPKGKSIAFVGESGAGKSTLADILLGVLQPTGGQVLVDGIDIKEIPNRWSRMISFVPQSIYLFDKSIMENIAFGEAVGDIDIEAVKDALDKARILDFVSSLPNGLMTNVGDRGVRLSGGQRQRLGIARALYRKPDILVLDEATSALDGETEKSVMEAIESLHGQLTMIIIAHRLTTIRNCDIVYELCDKSAIERKYSDLAK